MGGGGWVGVGGWVVRGGVGREERELGGRGGDRARKCGNVYVNVPLTEVLIVI